MRRAAIDLIYTPKFSGNRDYPEKEQCTVEMKVATLKERDQYQKMKYLKGGKMEFQKSEFTAIREKVTRINNYADENGTKIDTPKKLLEDMSAGSPESTDLCIELWNRIMGFDSALDDIGEDGIEEENLDDMDKTGEMKPGED